MKRISEGEAPPKYARRHHFSEKNKIEEKMMKKVFLFLAIAACFVFPFTAAATEGNKGSAEGNAVQNLEMSYSQEAGVQNISQYSVTNKTVESTGIGISGYAGFYYNSDPALLVFGDISGELTDTTMSSSVTQTTNATLYTMTGGVNMAGNAAASALATGQGTVTAMAGNSGTITQTQTLPNAWGGQGTQSFTATGYTGVVTTAK